MVDRVQTPEEEANQQRQARNEAERDEGVVGSVSSVVDTLLRPLADDRPDDEELARQREENDAAQRPS